MDERAARALAKGVFGVEGGVERLTSERDINFRVRAADGAQYVLKIAHAAEPEAAIAFQNLALTHLAAVDPSLAVPRVVRTRDGKGYVRVNDCLTRLLTWLDGPLLHQRPRTVSMRQSLGETHARLHAGLVSLDPPAAASPLLWDLQHMDRIENLLKYVAPTRRGLVACALDRHKARVAPQLQLLPAQLIHNDLNPHNVVLVEDGSAVRGVIDFGDMVHAPRICDIAVAAAYHVDAVDDPLAAPAEYVAAYNDVSPLGEDERAILTDLIVSRLAMTMLITSWRATLHPDNSAYILRNAPAAWAGLEAIVPSDLRLESGS